MPGPEEGDHPSDTQERMDDDESASGSPTKAPAAAAAPPKRRRKAAEAAVAPGDGEGDASMQPEEDYADEEVFHHGEAPSLREEEEDESDGEVVEKAEHGAPKERAAQGRETVPFDERLTVPLPPAMKQYMDSMIEELLKDGGVERMIDDLSTFRETLTVYAKDMPDAEPPGGEEGLKNVLLTQYLMTGKCFGMLAEDGDDWEKVADAEGGGDKMAQIFGSAKHSDKEAAPDKWRNSCKLVHVASCVEWINRWVQKLGDMKEEQARNQAAGVCCSNQMKLTTTAHEWECNKCGKHSPEGSQTFHCTTCGYYHKLCAGCDPLRSPVIDATESRKYLWKCVLHEEWVTAAADGHKFTEFRPLALGTHRGIKEGDKMMLAVTESGHNVLAVGTLVNHGIPAYAGKPDQPFLEIQGDPSAWAELCRKYHIDASLWESIWENDRFVEHKYIVFFFSEIRKLGRNMEQNGKGGKTINGFLGSASFDMKQRATIDEKTGKHVGFANYIDPVTQTAGKKGDEGEEGEAPEPLVSKAAELDMSLKDYVDQKLDEQYEKCKDSKIWKNVDLAIPEFTISTGDAKDDDGHWGFDATQGAGKKFKGSELLGVPYKLTKKQTEQTEQEHWCPHGRHQSGLTKIVFEKDGVHEKLQCTNCGVKNELLTTGTGKKKKVDWRWHFMWTCSHADCPEVVCATKECWDKAIHPFAYQRNRLVAEKQGLLELKENTYVAVANDKGGWWPAKIKKDCEWWMPTVCVQWCDGNGVDRVGKHTIFKKITQAEAMQYKKNPKKNVLLTDLGRACHFETLTLEMNFTCYAKGCKGYYSTEKEYIEHKTQTCPVAEEPKKAVAAKKPKASSKAKKQSAAKKPEKKKKNNKATKSEGKDTKAKKKSKK